MHMEVCIPPYGGMEVRGRNGCDCDEQARNGEVAHDIAVLAQKKAVAGAIAPGVPAT